jgi:hypothetical protein
MYLHHEGDAHQQLCRFGADGVHSVSGSTTKTYTVVPAGAGPSDPVTARAGASVRLNWTNSDPFAVTLHLGNKEPARWVFSRELLAHGGGSGAVRIRHGLVTGIELISPAQRITVRLCVYWIERFVRYTQDVMPLGTEPGPAHLSEQEWAAQIARLVEGQG